MLRRLERLGQDRQLVGVTTEMVDQKLTYRRRTRGHQPVHPRDELLELLSELARLEPSRHAARRYAVVGKPAVRRHRRTVDR